MIWSPLFVSSRAIRLTFVCKAFVMIVALYATSVSAACAQGSIQVWLKDGSGAPIRDAVIMLQPSGGATLAPRIPRRDITVQQIDREFVPRVSIAALGTRVTFPNQDVVQHSVYSFSKAKSFEIPIYAGDSPQTIMLDKAGVITLGCNIHDWMVGYIVVVDAPIAAVTKADGIVSIPDLPQGKYVVKVWHSQLKTGEFMQEVRLAGGEQRVDIKLELVAGRIRYKPPLNLKRY
jgi:plastocyanin